MLKSLSKSTCITLTVLISAIVFSPKNIYAQGGGCIKETIRVIFPVGATGLLCVTYPEPTGKVVSCIGLVAALGYAAKNRQSVMDACGWSIVEDGVNDATVELNGTQDEVQRMKNSLSSSGCRVSSQGANRCE